MTRARGGWLLALALLAGCAALPEGRPASLPEGPVTTPAGFAALVVGQDLRAVDDGAILRVSADGSWLERRANHIVASGIWDRAVAGWCRSGRRDGALFARRCAQVEHAAGLVVLTDPGTPPRRFRRGG